ARGQMMSDAAYQIRVAGDAVIAAGALHFTVLGGGVHAGTPRWMMRSRKNSTPPRASVGASQREVRRAISWMARAEGDDGYAFTTGCWRCTDRRSQSSCGTQPR